MNNDLFSFKKGAYYFDKQDFFKIFYKSVQHIISGTCHIKRILKKLFHYCLFLYIRALLNKPYLHILLYG